MSLYKHLTDADSIRLLALFPGALEEELVGELVVTTSSNQPEYETISYRWGPEPPNNYMIIDNNRFGLRPNIFHALRAFRRPNAVRMLWADATCINQGNLAERSAQVRLMARCYAEAQSVLVWLGPSQNLDSNAFETFHAVERILEERGLDPNTIPPRDDAIWTAVVSRITKQSHGIDALREFYGRDWFTRMWILQELIVAGKPVVCWSSFSTSWAAVRTVALAICYHFATFGRLPLYRNAAHVENMDDLRTDWLSYRPLTFGALMRVGIGLICTDRRDKVYSIIGLIRDLDPKAIDIDYAAPFGSAYESAMRYMLLTEPDPFSQLTFVSFMGSMPNFPSWVHSYSITPTTTRAYSHHTKTHQAHGGSNAHLSFVSTDPSVLAIRGYIVDRIVACPSYLGWLNSRATSVHTWYKSCHDILDTSTYPSGEDANAAWWRTAIADTVQIVGRGNRRAVDGYGPLYLDPRLSDYIIGKASLSEDEAFQEERQRYETYAIGVSTEVNFCRTSQGYIGWTPLTAQAGDLVCVFAGAGAPFILREHGDGDYKLIGDSYIHGLMSGEALGFPDFTWQDVRIR